MFSTGRALILRTISDRVGLIAGIPWGGIKEATVDAEHPRTGYIDGKDDYLRRLRRIEGQARGLQTMVEDEKYCIDILTQVSAMTSALRSVALGLLNDHLSHCVVDAARTGGPDADVKVKEAADAIARLVRS
jgi:DNA-binding FrmR family transcriptional regulator